MPSWQSSMRSTSWSSAGATDTARTAHSRCYGRNVASTLPPIRRLRHRLAIRTGRLRPEPQDFAALARERFAPTVPGGVAFIGDSHVALAPWPERPGRCCNRGLAGARIADVRGWIEGVLANQPAHIVLVAGSNDVFFGVPRCNSLAAARDLLDYIATRSTCAVTVVSVPPLAVARRAARALNAGLHAIVQERGFGWLDVVPILSAMDWTEDGLHLNAAAYRAVAPLIAAAVSSC